MKCSAWVRWHLTDDVMVPDETCPREATVLLSNPPHWEDQPYCDSCAGWMGAWAGRLPQGKFEAKRILEGENG